MPRAALPLTALLACLLGCPQAPPPAKTPPPAPPSPELPKAEPTPPPLTLPPALRVPPKPVAKPAAKPRAPRRAAERWYEIRSRGQKVGYSSVTWAPSTWQGRKTVHDSTFVLRRSVRDMGGHKDVFQTSVRIELERGAEGELWSQATTIDEGGRPTKERLEWTGKGYRYRVQIGTEPPQVREIPTERPVCIDAEAFLSARVRAGTLRVGELFSYPQLDLRAGKVHAAQVKVTLRERVAGLKGTVSCLKVVEKDPRSGAQTSVWLDSSGAYVRVQTDAGTIYQQTTRKAALGMPARPAEFSITTPSFPALPRVFSAEKHWINLHLQPDSTRPLPEFPTTPWSRVLRRRGDEREGYVYELELKAYGRSKTKGSLPVDAKRFAADLAPLPLMPAQHPALKREVKRVLQGERDLRRATALLARHVFKTLRKESPRIASTTALEILKERRGDCSEHCVLFVALCRSAGIPARRVTGYVSIGRMWGAHAWAEVWVGDWIGADPTTGEVGTAARYFAFGYPDREESYPQLVSSRASGRMRFLSQRIEEGGREISLSPARIREPAAGRYALVLAGIELVSVPPTWRVSFQGTSRVTIRGGSLRATLRVQADQGNGLGDLLGRPNFTYAGCPAYRYGGRSTRTLWIHSRRRLIGLTIYGGTKAERALLDKILLPTFSSTPKAQ